MQLLYFQERCLRPLSTLHIILLNQSLTQFKHLYLLFKIHHPLFLSPRQKIKLSQISLHLFIAHANIVGFLVIIKRFAISKAINWILKAFEFTHERRPRIPVSVQYIGLLLYCREEQQSSRQDSPNTFYEGQQTFACCLASRQSLHN